MAPRCRFRNRKQRDLFLKLAAVKCHWPHLRSCHWSRWGGAGYFTFGMRIPVSRQLLRSPMWAARAMSETLININLNGSLPEHQIHSKPLARLSVNICQYWCDTLQSYHGTSWDYTEHLKLKYPGPWIDILMLTDFSAGRFAFSFLYKIVYFGLNMIVVN